MSDEYISKQDMLDAVEKLDIIPSVDCMGNPTDTEDFRVQFLGAVLKIEPASDVVKVVRCEYCKHWHNGLMGMDCSWDANYPPQKNDFCSNGERDEK